MFLIEIQDLGHFFTNSLLDVLFTKLLSYTLNMTKKTGDFRVPFSSTQGIVRQIIMISRDTYMISR